jgi:hypothetical protein
MVPEDARSHMSAMSRRSGRSNASQWKRRNGSAVPLSRSIGDLTGKGYGLGLSRQGMLQTLPSLFVLLPSVRVFVQRDDDDDQCCLPSLLPFFSTCIEPGQGGGKINIIKNNNDIKNI